MRPITVTVGPLAAASANNIALTQTPTAAFTLNGALVSGGVAILDNPRRVLFTPAGNDTGKTITLTGTSSSNMPQSETIACTNAVAFYSALDYKTVTAISISSAAAGAYTVGTNGIASSPWVRLDEYSPAQVTVQCVASGTVNYTVQTTLQDPNSPTDPVLPQNVTWSNSLDAAAVAATGTIASFFAYTPVFARVLLNSGSGSVTGVFLQASGPTF